MDRRSKSEIDVGLFAVAREIAAPVALMRQMALSMEGLGDAERGAVSKQLVSVSERVLDQIDDLIKVSCLTDGLFEMEPVAVRGVCRDVTDEIARVLGVRLKVSYRNQQKLVVANRELLTALMKQLCYLGLRNTEAGTEARLSVNDTKGRVRLAVRDYGPSLPRTVVRNIRAGTMSRLAPSEMRVGGMGLVVASKFVEYMQGELGVVAHRDGVSLWVDLPVSRQATLC